MRIHKIVAAHLKYLEGAIGHRLMHASSVDTWSDRIKAPGSKMHRAVEHRRTRDKIEALKIFADLF